MFRGSKLFTADDLESMMETDPRGFRRLRPGSEGLLLLFYNSMKRGGRPSFISEKAARSVNLMRGDPEGVALATRLFGSVQKHASRLAEAALDGSWERASALRVEIWAAAQGLKDPSMLLARATYRFGESRCPLLPVLRRGRRVPGDVDAYLTRVARTHGPDAWSSFA
jgi:hypothetical protein